MSWVKAFSRISIQPPLQNFQSVKGPSLECRQTHLLDTWQDQEGVSRLRAPTRSSGQSLCERDEILAQHDDELFEPAHDSSHVFEGSDLDEQRRSGSSTCGLCQLISQLPTYSSDDNYGLYVINLLNGKERHVALDYPPEHFMMGLAVSEPNEARMLRRRLGNFPPRMEGIRREDLLVPAETEFRLPEDVRSPYHARILDPAQANFNSAKVWIQECSILHPSCSASNANLSGTIHVIDCESRIILPLPDGSEYLALSYVWGQQPSLPESPGDNELNWPNNVPANVPRTITDAMAVTLALDHRYLWCDRYCINQSDPVTKEFQLSLMDKIYEAAKVTLIAASGVDDRYGLPGAGTHPLLSRDRQPQAWIGSHRVVPIGPDILTTIQQSKWATRAWTFQEARLSTRCLIFGPRQLQFLCRTTSRYETLPRLPRLTNYDQGGEINIGSVFGGGTANQVSSTDMTILDSFLSLANEYLKRDITFESDTLNAFRGMLNRLEYFSFFGVPLITREGRDLCKPGTSDLQSSSNSPRTNSNQIATLLDSKRIIASSTLDQSKKRRQKNLFHAGDWHHYMYDEFPGPGEPMQPCPTLAFLHGLTWICNEKNWRDSYEGNSITAEVRRRSDMPSWSWVSLRKGPFSYRTDYDGGKELSGDVQLNLHNGIQVWVQQKSDLAQIEWISLDDAWRQCSGKVLPDYSRQIKLKTLTSDVESCTVTMPKFKRKKYECIISLRSLDATDERKLILDLDCAPEDLPVSGPGIHQNLGWKIALILSTSFYNPDHEDTWRDTKPRRDYLVLRPVDSIWKRVGIMTTNIHFADRDEGVKSVLKPETLILY